MAPPKKTATAAAPKVCYHSSSLLRVIALCRPRSDAFVAIVGAKSTLCPQHLLLLLLLAPVLCRHSLACSPSVFILSLTSTEGSGKEDGNEEERKEACVEEQQGPSTTS